MLPTIGSIFKIYQFKTKNFNVHIRNKYFYCIVINDDCTDPKSDPIIIFEKYGAKQFYWRERYWSTLEYNTTMHLPLLANDKAYLFTSKNDRGIILSLYDNYKLFPPNRWAPTLPWHPIEEWCPMHNNILWTIIYEVREIQDV